VLVIASTEGVLAATLGPTAIVAVALVTAVTTNRRQREALKHDRELADLADLRKLLDEAAVALNEAADAFDLLLLELHTHGRKLPGEVRERLAACGNRLLEVRARLTVRVGLNSRLARAFGEAADALHAAWREVGWLEDDDDEVLQGKRELVELAHDDWDAAFGAFLTAAVDRAGAVPTKGGEMPAEQE